MLHATRYMPNCPHLKPVLNFITRLFMCSFSTAFFLPRGIFMIRTKADEKAWSGFMFVNNIYGLWKGAGSSEHWEKTVKRGRSGGAKQCRRAAARFYGLGSCSQPPPPPSPSSFLRCTVVYTWATMNHVCWKKQGRTIKQWGRAERQCMPVNNAWHVVCNTFVTSFSINLTYAQHLFKPDIHLWN